MKIGFIGLGRMGYLMAANISSAGFPLVVYNRTRTKAEGFAETYGATVARSPEDLARAVDVIITMLSDEDAVHAVYDGADGVLSGLRPETICIDMSTIGPSGTERLRHKLSGFDVKTLDAPVSGSTAAAEARTLMIMVGGSEDTLDSVRLVLAAMGDPILHVGPSGAGSTLKLAINSIIYGINQAVSEALVMAERAGLDRSVAYEAFTQSAIAAPVVVYRRPVFESPGTTPVTFTIDLAIKDLELIGALGAATGTEQRQAVENLAVMRDASAAGYGDRDMGDIAVYLRDANNQ